MNIFVQPSPYVAAAGPPSWGFTPPGPAPWNPWNGGKGQKSWTGGASGKGKGQGKWSSDAPYFDSTLRPGDHEAYCSAGLLIFRKVDNGIEVLVAVEKPWNPFTNDYDPLAWNPLGGKKLRGKGQELDPPVTAARCLLEVFGGCEGAPSSKEIAKMCRSSPTLWYPVGKFVLYVHEYTAEDGEVFFNAPSVFATAKEKGLYPHSPQEETRLNFQGQPTTKWVKQIERLEWVLADDLLQSDPRTPLTDLMKNVCLAESFRQFLQSGTLPALPAAVPQRDDAGMAPKGKDKGKDKGGKKGGKDKGKYKGGKDSGKAGIFPGKGMPYAGFAPGPPPPMTQPAAPSVEMQRQIVGEKLFMLVQPVVNSPMIAQKVTGMLLELPMPELLPLLAPGPEGQHMLHERVNEAKELLESEEGAN